MNGPIKSDCSDTSLSQIATHFLAMAELAFFMGDGCEGAMKAYGHAYARLSEFIRKYGDKEAP